MGGYSGDAIVETPEWRIAVLFLTFIFITLAWEWGSHALDHYLHHHLKHGLRHTIK